jgi:DNA-binding transcriptional MerR regulator
MDKSPDAFRTISEVADWLGVQAHVLRFWESKFTHVKPVKRAGGRRYYRPADMKLLGGIKKLLHDDGLTIKGVQKMLREQGIGTVSSLSPELNDVAAGTPEATSDAGVVTFKSKAAKVADVAQDASQPIQIDHVAKPEPKAPITAATPAATPVEMQPDADAPLQPPPTESVPIAAPPVVVSEAIEDAVETENPVLPSFLHRRTPTPESVAAPTRARIIDAPDPPNESDIPYSRGPMALLAKLDVLSPQQAALIAPVAKELRAWLGRSGSTSAT